MAKRTQPEEVPYRPLLNMELISAAIAPEPAKPTASSQIAPNLELVESQRRTLIPPQQQHIEEPKRTEVAATQPPKPSAQENLMFEPFDHQKRVLFTAAESLALDRIAYDLSMKFKTQVKVSHVVRAMLRPFLTSEAYISAVASFSPPLARPGNANLQEIREFEQAIVAIMESALLKRLELKAA